MENENNNINFKENEELNKSNDEILKNVTINKLSEGDDNDKTRKKT
jgi:hypothetical protein